MTPRVVVVGALNVDLVVKVPRLPGPGETVVGPEVQRHGGGKGANAAVAAARAGAEVRYVGAVGADDLGTGALAELVAENIDVSGVVVEPGVATGTALIVVDHAGENQIAVAAGANAVVSPESVRQVLARSRGWATCVLVSTEIPMDAVVAAVETARAYDLPCVLNPAPVAAGLAGLVSMSPVLTPNQGELRDLCRALGEPDETSLEAMASAVAHSSKAAVAVTLGADGVMVADPDGSTCHIPAAPVAEVVDTTGAGDTFNGVLAAALASGETISGAVRRGVAAASISVGSAGARAGMPTAEVIDAALASP
ncbi:ribokinase [Nocardioides daejeonensis]|uniref:ribokinase n=1 Tax=Nocardioides daejeonensis TaxID=1046556 RepID=UPI000D74D763|nr:ribokinase [Nocardioides daejeonensis]